MADHPLSAIPQLVIAGHGAIDDPDATPIFESTVRTICTLYPEFSSDIIVARVGPTDQILNALMANASVALQLSSREGFEVKVSEALHAGTPVIATQRGGIPLQVAHQRSGFLVDSPDHAGVAKYLAHLFSDDEAREDMSSWAEAHVSDEVGTVGNALCWMYLAEELAKGKSVRPGARWVVDMAREEAGVKWDVGGEVRLPRMRDLENSDGAHGL
jgi:glycosyltransferase involved in cell wall biosynthesis